jgi:hypothetical protein
MRFPFSSGGAHPLENGNHGIRILVVPAEG